MCEETVGYGGRVRGETAGYCGRMCGEFLEYIRRHDLLLPGELVVVGLSGGADSVCLLLLLDRLREVLGIGLRAVHVHHGLRGDEADRDEAFSRKLAGRLGVPFVCVHVDAAGYAKQHGMSVEEAGRCLRYEALERERAAAGAAKIAVAHHGDDQAETILYNLFRGTGLKGLGGMSPMRGRIIRPLLFADRKEILAYLEENGEGYCEDSSNAEDDYCRNRLRHKILPLVKEMVNERAQENILQAGAMAAEADRYFEKKAGEILAMYLLAREKPAGIGIPAEVLKKEEPIIASYVVRDMVGRACGSKKDITHVHIGQVLSLLEKPVGRSIDLPCAQKAVRTYGELWITDAKEAETVDENPANSLPSLEFTAFPYKKGQEIPKNRYTKWFDYDKINSTLSVRYRKAGDYFMLAGERRKTLKAFFIDEKIPKEERDRIPLVADGSHILWIVGYRISEHYKITEETETVLQIQTDGGRSNG